MRRQNVDPGGNEAGEDCSCLFRRFSAGIDDLRQARPQTSMMIDARVTEIFKRQHCKALCGVVRR